MERSTHRSEYKVGCPCEEHVEAAVWIECTERATHLTPFGMPQMQI